MEGTKVFEYLKLINDRTRHQFDLSLKELNLTFSQAGVLRLLYENDGQMSQREIEKAMQVSHPTIVGLVSRLEKNGFVTTHTCDTDHRNKIIESTDKALEHRAYVQSSRKKFEELLLAHLSDQDVSELERMLSQIRDNIFALPLNEDSCKEAR